MEAYLDGEVVFSSPICTRKNDSPPHATKDPRLMLRQPRSPSALWALGRQTMDGDRVFRFEEEEKSPIKQQLAFIEMRDKKKTEKKLGKSRWESAESEESQEEEERDDDKENTPYNTTNHAKRLEFLEIEEQLSKLKLEKEVASFTKLVQQSH
jgi:hypothetical protein